MTELDRRRDPRTDPAYSLQNLLRTRADRLACKIAALGTSEGLVMAASRLGRVAEEALATASATPAGGRIGPALVTRRIELGAQAVLLALVTFKDVDEGTLDDLAGRVRSILREPAARRGPAARAAVA